MRHPATASFRPSRRTALLVTLVTAIAATTGCSWFNRDASVYAMNEASRPLEVPPDLVVAETAGVSATTAETSSALRSETRGQGAATTTAAAAMGAAAGGFNVALPSDQAFARVGEVLAGIEGLEIASKAQLLGAYDVRYRGGNFLVRVTPVQGGTYVSAVDPRGIPATGEGTANLMAALKAELGGQ